jgi:type I restriction enzyme S subunit
MRDDLPQGWAECTLGDIIKIQNGYAFPSKEFRGVGIPLIRQGNLAGERVSLEKCVYLEPRWLGVKPDFILRKNDVLIGMSGSVGKLCIYDRDEPALQNQRTGKIVQQSTEFVDWRFVWEYLKTVELQLLEKGKGLGVLNVSATDIESLPFRLAPFNEQRQIVAKLEKLLGKVDASQQRLVKIPIILKRFRQSVLAAACSGRLTADWREDDQYQNDFPLTWTMCKLSDISTLITKGASPKWQGVNYAKNGVLFVTSENVGLGKMLLSTKKFVESKINEIQPRSVLQNGDVLTNIVGASIGRSAIFDRDDVANINQAVALIRLTNAVNRKYILHVLNSPVIIEHMESEKVDVARANLSLKDVGNYPIPLPPLTEQEEIVHRVEVLFTLADQIEARFVKAKARIDQLTQSLLAKAFRGELVRQDPNDEPASVLLERIKAERTEGETEGKGGAKKRLKVNRKGKGL